MANGSSKVATITPPKRDNRGRQCVLTDKMVAFAYEYAIDMNATRAAEAVGYKTANVMGAKLLCNPLVTAQIAKLLEKRFHRCELTAERLLQELSYIALRDPLDLCDEEGRLQTDLRKLPLQARRCIESIEQRTYTNKDGETVVENKLKLAGKLQAIELAMKHFGMLEKGAQINKGDSTVVNWDALYEDSSVVEDVDTNPSTNVGGSSEPYEDPNTIVVNPEPKQGTKKLT